MNRRIKTISIVFLMILTSLLTACSGESVETEKKNPKPVVAVSIVPQATFVNAVCGDLVNVVTMIPPGASPESYEPTPKQMTEFSKASRYFTIGVPMEETSILPNAENVNVISLQQTVAEVYPDRTFEEGERDPHIWLSPKRAKIMVQVIADEMSNIDSQNKDTYQKNAKSYIEKLDKLDKEIATAFEGLQNKKIVVFHPAFGYLCDDYGIEMLALEEEGKEATPQHLQEMIDLAKKENIKVIFYQEETDSKQAKAYAEEIGGKTTQLAPLAADYIENLEKMAETIKEAIN